MERRFEEAEGSNIPREEVGLEHFQVEGEAQRTREPEAVAGLGSKDSAQAAEVPCFPFLQTEAAAAERSRSSASCSQQRGRSPDCSKAASEADPALRGREGADQTPAGARIAGSREDIGRAADAAVVHTDYIPVHTWEPAEAEEDTDGVAAEGGNSVRLDHTSAEADKGSNVAAGEERNAVAGAGAVAEERKQHEPAEVESNAGVGEVAGAAAVEAAGASASQSAGAGLRSAEAALSRTHGAGDVDTAQGQQSEPAGEVEEGSACDGHILLTQAQLHHPTQGRYSNPRSELHVHEERVQEAAEAAESSPVRRPSVSSGLPSRPP